MLPASPASSTVLLVVTRVWRPRSLVAACLNLKQTAASRLSVSRSDGSLVKISSSSSSGSSRILAAASIPQPDRGAGYFGYLPSLLQRMSGQVGLGESQIRNAIHYKINHHKKCGKNFPLIIRMECLSRTSLASFCLPSFCQELGLFFLQAQHQPARSS